MSRFVSGTSLAAAIVACLIASACSKGTVTTVIANQVPASVDLCVSPAATCSAGLNVSLEVGQFQVLSATGLNPVGQVLTETFAYQSSNPAVLTISTNGAACAGTWNSLTAPSVCTPGPTGTAQVTATALGVSSPPVTFYVHQHITRVSISKVPNQPPSLSTLCYSKGAPSGPENALYQAFAFNGNADITSTVGPFGWQNVSVTGQTISAVSLRLPPVGAPMNQVIATASAPGITPFFATVNGFHSQPMQFETCPVQTISLAALGNPATSFVVNTGTTTTLNATVTDILGMNLTGVPLTWISSNPISVAAAGASSTIYGSVGAASASAIGASSVIASCTPPTCNGGIAPSMPIYPVRAISFKVNSASAPASPAAYVSSTGCSATTAACNTTVIPITKSGGSFTVGNPVVLPSTPNSFQFDARGSSAYLGVDSSSFGTRGLMVFTGSSASQVNSAAGKVLAVSPNVTLASSQVTSLVVLSDTVDTPNQVFVYNNSSQSAGAFLIDKATAAAFSPDGLKAYVVSGSTCPGAASAGCLLVFSTVDAAQTIPLPTPATDTAFIGEGSFGYIAGGNPAGTAFLPTCSDPNPLLSLGSFNMASQLIRPLPDGQSALALAPPNVQEVAATITGAPVPGFPGCPTPRGFLTINNTPSPSIFNLGIGNFTPTQFIISPDGSQAYILAEAAPAQQSVVNIPAASQSGGSTTYSYTLTSGPPLQIGTRIVITSMQNLTDNGVFTITGVTAASGSTLATFTVVNASGINATGENGTGIVTPRFPFITVFDLNTQVPSNISLAGNAVPLSASLSPAGDLLFVGADDGAVHIIDTGTLADTSQLTFPFPQTPLCFAPGSPITAPPVTCLPDLVAVRP